MEYEGFPGGAWREKKEIRNQLAVKFKLQDTFVQGMQKVGKYLCKKQRRQPPTWRYTVQSGNQVPPIPTQEPQPARDHAHVTIQAWTPAFEGLKAAQAWSHLSQAKSVHLGKKATQNRINC